MGSSVNSMTTIEPMEQIAACRQLRRRGSTSPTYLSTKMICRAKATAQARSSKSPVLTLVTPMQLKKYRPITAITTLKGTIGEVFLRRKKPITGTKTMYIAVRNPDFPASTVTMPICCRFVAKNKGMAQEIPAFQSLASENLRRKSLPKPSFLSKRYMIGRSANVPMPQRMP